MGTDLSLRKRGRHHPGRWPGTGRHEFRGDDGRREQCTVTVPPGRNSFHTVPLTLTVAAGTAAASYPFRVTATSATDSSVTARARGTLEWFPRE